MNSFFKKFKKILFRNNGEDISYIEAKKILKEQKNAILLDVRSSQEYREDHLQGAINIPLYELENTVEKKIPDKESIIIVYCKTGNRSRNAKDLLKVLGYLNVYHIHGGMEEIIE